MPVAVPIAMVVAAGVSAVVSKYNADQQSAAAGNALGAQEKAAGQATTALQQAQAQATQNVQPWVTQGQTALSTLSQPQNQKFTFSTSGANADPSYQFRQQEGQAAIEASAAARGGYFSGAMGSALQESGQQLASQEYQNEYNRWLSTNNMLQNESNSGLQATEYASGLGYNTGQSLAGLAMTTGQNQANTINNQSGYQAGAVQNIANTGNSLASYYALQNLIAQNQNNNVTNNMTNTGYGADQVSQNSQLINNMQTPQLTYDASGGY